MNLASHHRSSFGCVASLIGVAMLLFACSPASPVTPAADQGKTTAKSGPKTIVFAIQDEFAYLVPYGHIPID